MKTLLGFGVAVTLLFLVGGLALAQSTSSTGNTYTGCLHSNGVSGNLGNVAIGTSPTLPCKNSEVQISWNEKGEQGAPGLSSIRFYQVREVRNCADRLVCPEPMTEPFIAHCESGDIAVGGGAFYYFSGASNPYGIWTNLPYPSTNTSEPPTGWMIPQQFGTPGGPLTVFAICADITP